MHIFEVYLNIVIVCIERYIVYNRIILNMSLKCSCNSQTVQTCVTSKRMLFGMGKYASEKVFFYSENAFIKRKKISINMYYCIDLTP